VNSTRLLMAVGATLAFNVLFSLLVHGVLLGATHREHSGGFLRTEADVKSKMGWLLAGWTLFSLAFCLILVFLRPRATVVDGVVYGLAMGVLMIAVHISLYATLPMPRRLAVLWTATDVFASAGAGAIAAAVYAEGGAS
jgi:hypothetical protein